MNIGALDPALVRALREKIETQAEEIRSLRALAFGPEGLDNKLALALRVTVAEGKLLSCILTLPLGTKEALYEALYFNYSNGKDSKIIDVLICRLRKRLPPGVEVKTVWGRGYMLMPEAKKTLRAFVDRHFQTLKESPNV